MPPGYGPGSYVPTTPPAYPPTNGGYGPRFHKVGPTGPTGPTGPRGPQGPAGPQGPQGDAGDNVVLVIGVLPANPTAGELAVDASGQFVIWNPTSSTWDPVDFAGKFCVCLLRPV